MAGVTARATSWLASDLFSHGFVFNSGKYLFPARRTLHHRAPDYYAILGVAKGAALEDVKFAYFNMARKFHPDLNKTLDAKQMFALVAEAYDVLSDEERRAKYDETGLSENKFGGTSSGPGRQATDSTYTAEQMYETIFGKGAGEEDSEAHAHEDFAESHAGNVESREYIVRVSAEEAVRGVRVGVQLRLAGICDKCNGSRSELGFTGRLCPYCEGTGQETIRTGHITARRTCSYCNGEKIFIKFKCNECEGLGSKMYDVYQPVDVPAGTVHGEVLRVEVDNQDLARRQGWRGAPSALRDLFVTVNVEATEAWGVDGRDITATLELGAALALLGGTAPFASPARVRVVEVVVRPGTSSHTVIVVPEEGLRSFQALPGDLVLRTAIRVPAKLSWRQARIARRFAMVETSDCGTVEGVTSDLDHRLGVNVVTADKVSNSVLKVVVKRKGYDETFLDRFRTMMGWQRPVIGDRSAAASNLMGW